VAIRGWRWGEARMDVEQVTPEIASLLFEELKETLVKFENIAFL
jgi:hypothetical protein